MITGGFGYQLDIESGQTRRWYMQRDGIKRWFDNGQPVKQKEKEAASAASSGKNHHGNAAVLAGETEERKAA